MELSILESVEPCKKACRIQRPLLLFFIPLLPPVHLSPVYLVQIRHMSVYIAGECHCKELCFCPVAVCFGSHSALSDHPCHTLHGHLSSLLDLAFRSSVALHSAAMKNLVCGLLGVGLQDLSLVGSPGRNVNANVIVSCCICLQNGGPLEFGLSPGGWES